MNITRVFIAASVVAFSGCECGTSPGVDAGRLDAPNRTLEDAAEPPDTFSFDGGVDAPVADPLDGLVSALVTAYCAEGGYTQRCVPYVLQSSVPCELGARDYFNSVFVEEVRASIAAGRATYNPAALPSCVAAMRTGACEVSASRLPAGCEDLIVGTVASGVACSGPEECVAGLVCAGTAPCARTCQPARATGEACNTATDCSRDAECLGSCVRRGRSGDACGPSAECAFGLGFFCHEGFCAALSEIPLGTEGEPCATIYSAGSSSGWCAQGHYCISGTCMRAGELGAACGAGMGCVLFAHCESGVCVSNPGAGMACDPGLQCLPGYACQSGVCARRAPNGSTCGSAIECQSGVCSGTCRASSCE